MAGSTGQLDAWVDDLIEDVYQQVDQHVGGGADQDDALGDGEIMPQDGFDRQFADAVPGEDVFDDESPAEQARQSAGR